MFDLDVLYNMDFNTFCKSLEKNCGVSKEQLVKVLLFEIEVLNQSYKNQVSLRDTKKFNPRLAIALQDILEHKKSKLLKYKGIKNGSI